MVRRCPLLPLLLLALPFAACTSAPNEIDRQLLVPPAPWLAEPEDFGLQAEPFEVVLHSSASLTGYWIPHENGEKRTVVLFHDGDVNVSVMHPYYRFLHDAGFQVLAFDPRGYGKSKGAPTMQAWLHDLPKLMSWLQARPDVDAQRIAFFGTGLGGIAAIWAARTQGCQALVLEHLPSPRAMLQEAQGGDGSALGAMQLGFTEYSSMPPEIEPEDFAPRTHVPALFLASDGEPARDRKALVRTFNAYAGPKQLWMLAGTAKPPNGMLTHDGEYQQQIASFLGQALAGSPPVFQTAMRKVDTTRDGQSHWQVDVTPPAHFATWGNLPAVEVCAVLADGSVHFARALLEGGKARVRLKLPSPPVCTSAIAVPNAEPDAANVFRRHQSPRALAGAAIDPLWTRIETLRGGSLSGPDLRSLHKDLADAEAKAAFPPDLEAELADVFATIGKEFADSPDAGDRATGQKLLQRAIAAVPKEPRLHVWPGPVATYGYPQEEAVAMARRLLAAPAKD